MTKVIELNDKNFDTEIKRENRRDCRERTSYGSPWQASVFLYPQHYLHLYHHIIGRNSSDYIEKICY